MIVYRLSKAEIVSQRTESALFGLRRPRVDLREPCFGLRGPYVGLTSIVLTRKWPCFGIRGPLFCPRGHYVGLRRVRCFSE